MNDNLNKLVIDLGKTNIKFVIINNKKIKFSTSFKTPKSIKKKQLYLDIKLLWKSILYQLKYISQIFNVHQITTVTHGATFVVIKNDKLFYPILDYESEIPANIEKEYNDIRENFNNCYSPQLPNGLNVGKQIYFYCKKYKLHNQKNIKIIFFPQFFALLFSGKAVSEKTYLGCHTDLWNPIKNDYSEIVKNYKWEKFFCKIEPIGCNLGSIRNNLSKLTRLNPNCSTLNGGHDSSIAYAAFLSKKNTSPILINSGTWTIIMSRFTSEKVIDNSLDIYIGTNVLDKPLMVSRFMGGREYKTIKKMFQNTDSPKLSDLKNIIFNDIFCLPSFSSIGGPFKSKKGVILGINKKSINGSALSSLYVALMTTFYLKRMNDKFVIIEGNLTKNSIFCYCLNKLNSEKQFYIYRKGNTIPHGFLNILSNFNNNVKLDKLNFNCRKDNLMLDDYYKKWTSLIENF